MFFLAFPPKASKAATALPSPCEASPSTAQPTKRARTTRYSARLYSALPTVALSLSLDSPSSPGPQIRSLWTDLLACPPLHHHQPSSSLCRQSRKPENPQNFRKRVANEVASPSCSVFSLLSLFSQLCNYRTHRSLFRFSINDLFIFCYGQPSPTTHPRSCRPSLVESRPHVSLINLSDTLSRRPRTLDAHHIRPSCPRHRSSSIDLVTRPNLPLAFSTLK